MGNCLNASKQANNDNVNFAPINVDEIAPEMTKTQLIPGEQSPEGVPLKHKVDEKEQMQTTDHINTSEFNELQQTIALSQKEEIKRIQHESLPNFNNMPFVEHMSIKEADKLYIGESVDFRDESNKFILAMIAEKNENILKIQYENTNQQIVEYECNYNVEIHRLATKQTISQRPYTDNKFSALNINNKIDINPMYSAHSGWRIGTIVAFDYSEYNNAKLQVEIEYEDDNIKYRYWTHFDNKNEVAPRNTKSCKVIVNNNQIKQVKEEQIVSEMNDAQKPMQNKPIITECKEKQNKLVTIKSSEEQNNLDKNKNYVFHKEGLIEIEESWLWSTKWIQRWMVLNGNMLQLFSDKTCVKIIDNFNLLQCVKIEKIKNSENEFVLYTNGGTEVVKFRVINNDDIHERQVWIQCIHTAIGKHNGYQKHDTFLIQTKFSSRFNGQLKCKFMQNNKYHAELIIYNELPQHNDDSVIRIDLIYETMTDKVNDSDDEKKEIKKSIVRLQSKCWSEFKQREINNEEYMIDKSLKDIICFCIDYQNKHPLYKEMTANCRIFMIQLSDFLGIKYPNSYIFEPLLYIISSKMSGLMVQSMNENQIDCAVTDSDGEQKQDETVIVTEKQWQCSKCTCVNHIDLPYCEACYSRRNE
eukprot:203217_1